MTPDPSKTYRLLDTIGNGSPGTIYAGQEVRIREVVEASTPGAHNDREDAVVVEFEEDSPVLNEEGKIVRGKAVRSTSIASDQFLTLFEEA